MRIRHTRTGQVVSLDRQTLKRMMRALGLKGGRQKRKLRKALKRETA